jgi:bifunctional DNA primase/polymerase-like protein/primase-like protein
MPEITVVTKSAVHAPVWNETVACAPALLNSMDFLVWNPSEAVHEIDPATWLPIFTAEVKRLLAHPTMTIECAMQTALDMLSEMRAHPDWRAARQSLAALVLAAPPVKRLRRAVQAASEAYANTGRMVDAALAYTDWGIPVFPLSVRTKKPIPKRDPDPTGKFKDGIPGTGGIYKATTDPQQIREWWRKNPKALIAIPMGAKTGVWALDIDTPEDHEDGVTGWNEIAAQHEPIVTREHRSATDGPHLIFKWDDTLSLGDSPGALPDGISVKGVGYIVAPPSRRKGRAYTVYRDIDPIDAPEWLTDLILQGRPASASDGEPWSTTTVDVDKLADAMQFVPNDELSWEEWTAHGLALIAVSGGSERGLDLFDAFSQKSNKYDAETTCQRWEEMRGSPPNRTGAGKLFAIARANGWLPKAAPTYSVEGQHTTADEARIETRRIVRDFLHGIAQPDSNTWIDYWFHINKKINPPTELAIRVPTGVGKTKITIEELVEWIRDVSVGPVIYAVPRHKLGRKIEEQFTQHGLNVRVFRGLTADDPENPCRHMCLNLHAVELALRCHAPVSTTCCRYKKMKCRYFDRCGYQRQMPAEDEKVDVWVIASDTLFRPQKVFGKPAAVIIDEAIWRKGLRGVEQMECSVPICSLITPQPEVLDATDSIAMRSSDRNWLGEALQKQPENGGVARKLFDNLPTASSTRAISLEWKCMPPIDLRPGMVEADVKRLARDSERIDAIQHAHRVIKIWQAVREIIEREDIVVSGRLTLVQQNGQRVVEWKGVAPIRKQFRVPTLLLDATLPGKSILQVYHPHVEVAADVKVAMPPHVYIRQILRAPTTATKLIGKERHLSELRRYVLQRWMETGRQQTLVVCQEKAEQWLRERLPDNIPVAHFNDIAGLDDYKDARLLILAGRTQPGPGAVEALAGALTGAQPAGVAADPRGFTWYPQVERGIRTADGRGIAVHGDQHPDAAAEDIRWQICEAELIQALGRGRAVNRTAVTPLDVDLLFDVCLPITVDHVETWKRAEPSLLIETAVDGVMLTSPVDMVRLYPSIWSHEKKADRTIKQGVPALPGFQAVTYQLVGERMKPRLAYFDSSLLPDPQAWLEERLGCAQTPLRVLSLCAPPSADHRGTKPLNESLL